jgi:phospholipase C
LKTLASLLLLALVASACSSNSGASSLLGSDSKGMHRRTTSDPIQHVVIIMQENRSFDNFFYDYPGANGATQGNGHDGRVYPLLPLPLKWTHDQNHYHWQFLEDYDSGANDGFEDQILGSKGGANCPPGNWFNEPNCWNFVTMKNLMVQPYTYAIQAQIQPYWDMANQYVLGDNTYASNNGPTFVSHQYLIAGQAGHASEVPSKMPWGCDAPAESENYLLFGAADPPAFPPVVGHEIQGQYPCFPSISATTPWAQRTYPTIATELDNAGITWRYYVQPSPKDSFWLNAFDAVRAIRYGPDWKSDISMPDTNVLTDITSGNLAQVSWVMPHGGASDHPGGGSGNCGPDWVASIVNEIGKSQYWNNTAIIVMWDEWGGWYDHVLPPQYTDPFTGAQEGLGYRIPLLIVSPYAKAGYISHQQHEIASTLHFIERTFNLPFLGSNFSPPVQLADQRADAFDDAFDFTQQPIAFKPIALVNEPGGQCPLTTTGLTSRKWPPEIDY